MKPSCWRRTRALLLTIVLGAGLSLSLGQANAMSAHMAVAPEMADPGSDQCHGCDCGDAGGADALSCLFLCASAAPGVLPEEPADLSYGSRAVFRVADVVGNGHVSGPAHGPPKPLTLTDA